MQGGGILPGLEETVSLNLRILHRHCDYISFASHFLPLCWEALGICGWIPEFERASPLRGL